MQSVMGLVQNKDGRVCNVCGQGTKMSRAHVPPQAAGNDHRVQRSYILEGQPAATQGRALEGGMWVYGLCNECNNLSGSLYDRAYADFAHALELWYFTPSRILRPAVPWVRLAPGRVARSVLFGMHALNPQLRAMHPTLASQLLDRGRVRLPAGFSLHVAAHLSKRAQLNGPIFTVEVLGTPSQVNTLAAITFRPLTWALATSDSRTGFAERGWTDASEWPLYEDDHTVGLGWLTNRFDIVHEIINEPGTGGGVHLFSPDITPIMQGCLA